MMDKRLKEAVEQITLTEESRRRILNLEKKKKKRHQIRIIKRNLLAVCMVFLTVLTLSFFPKGDGQAPEWKITAYAREADEAQWLSLEPGARVLLELIPKKL